MRTAKISDEDLETIINKIETMLIGDKDLLTVHKIFDDFVGNRELSKKYYQDHKVIKIKSTSPEILDKWFKDYSECVTLKNIAEKYHISTLTLRKNIKILKENNPERYEQIVESRESVKAKVKDAYRLKVLEKAKEKRVHKERMEHYKVRIVKPKMCFKGLENKVTKIELCDWACKNKVDMCMRDLIIKAKENDIEVVA